MHKRLVFDELCATWQANANWRLKVWLAALLPHRSQKGAKKTWDNTALQCLECRNPLVLKDGSRYFTPYETRLFVVLGLPRQVVKVDLIFVASCFVMDWPGPKLPSYHSRLRFWCIFAADEVRLCTTPYQPPTAETRRLEVGNSLDPTTHNEVLDLLLWGTKSACIWRIMLLRS